MGFEAPLALLALAAAGLPIVAHLLRRQDLPRRLLPTIALLRRAEAASKKRVRLVDLLLLIVRVALIAMAALAIARPFWRVTLAYGDGSIASVAIVVDDSMSMAGREDPSLLARALERAREVTSSLPAESEVAIVLAGAPARVLVARTGELAAAERALSSLPATRARGTDLPGAIALAERELSGARHADRRLLILSDVAAHGGLDGASLPSGVGVEIERVGEDAEARNAAITAARATPDPTTPGRASIAVEVAAQGMDGRELTLSLRRGGETIAEQPIAIASGGARATLNAQLDPADPGATLALDADDALPMDDARGVLLRPPAGARVLIVDSEPERGREASRYLTRAIDLAPDDGGALTRRRVDPETFAALDPSQSDVIVLADVAAPNERVAARLREHVERGGGLLIAPGDDFDARAYIARFGELLPARPMPAVASEIGGPVPAEGSALLPAGTSGLEQTRTSRRLTFEDVDAGAEVALRFEDGSPALLIGRAGDGRVALLATSLDDAWTDLPLRPGYLPLVVALLRELAPASSTPDAPVLPGSTVRLRAPAGAVRLAILTPGGERIEHTGDALDAPIELTDTLAPGVYRVQVATREHALAEDARLAFVVAPPAEESDLTPGTVPPLEGAEAGAARQASVVQRPLAPWLFLLVGVLAVLEAALRMRAGQLARKPA